MADRDSVTPADLLRWQKRSEGRVWVALEQPGNRVTVTVAFSGNSYDWVVRVNVSDPERLERFCAEHGIQFRGPNTPVEADPWVSIHVPR